MICKRCLNDNSVRNITFDSDGICCFCRGYERLAEKLNDRRALQTLFENRIERVRGRHRYDAALGISGGKDSIYVLSQLTGRYGLKIKTFTMNNGFLTPEAIENIDRLVKEFGVEHEYITFDPQMMKRVYHYSMSRLLVPCIACSYIGYAAQLGYATRVDAGMCIHGRSPEQMLRSYPLDVFSRFIDMGLEDGAEQDFGKAYMSLLDTVKEKVDADIYNDIRTVAFEGIDVKELREFVPFFLYHPYNEAEVVQYLKRNTSWRPPADYNHFDCGVHNAARYIYQRAEGRPHCLPEISVLVRTGCLSREEGRALLQKEIIRQKPKDELKTLCGFAGVSQTLLFTKAEIYNKVLKP